MEPPLIVGPKWNLEDVDEPTALNFSCVGCFEPIRVLRHKCPMCNWPACSPDCSGLINPELHDIECGLLRIGKGPADRTDVRAIKEYYRSDALLALKILLLQRKNPKKFKLMMTMEANEKARLLTYNYKEAEERIMYLETNFLKHLFPQTSQFSERALAICTVTCFSFGGFLFRLFIVVIETSVKKSN